jgi:outer membrane protein OmpA-like peptidoglycan-associated protein
MKYVSEHGIDAARLTAQGFGPKRPIADNNTAEGRQRNRRVEFHIKEQTGDKPAAGRSP